MIMGIDPVVEAVADQQAQVLREAIGQNTLALDEAGIAVTRSLAGSPVLVDDHDAPALACQLQGAGNADNAGADHEGNLGHVS